MPRALAGLVAVVLTGFLLASPGITDAKPKPKPSPTPAPTASPTLPPSGGYLDGIDVSHHQGTIDWTRVAGAGKRFVFIRASAGTLTADTTYGANYSGAHAAGLDVGSYHFANPDAAANDAANEASWFLQRATIASGDILPVLDLEVANGLTSTALTAWARTWLEAVSSATGVRPIIYTTPNFWSSSMANTDWFARNGYQVLWIAHWTTASQPSVPAGGWGGAGWTFWQHSSTGSVPGVTAAVDLDRFNGTAIPTSLRIP